MTTCIEPGTFSDGFKLAMRRLAATVSIITTSHDKQRYGMIATAISSVCVEPPMLLICINRSASLHNPVIEQGEFCVNLLGTRHGELVGPFSGKVANELRFENGDWDLGRTGMPYLKNAPASVFCSIFQVMECGTHSIIIGKVRDVMLTDDLSPLIYQDGKLATTRAMEAIQ